MTHFHKTVIFLIILAVNGFSVTAYSNEVPKAEFLKVTKYMMMEPCTISAYMKCLGINPAGCQKAVQTSFKSCDGKVPDKIVQATIQNVINTYGTCMTDQIRKRMKLTEAKLDKCESVLQANVQKPGTKK